MAIEYQTICKDCLEEFGYSKASIESGSARGLSRPERCPACRRIHSRESRSIGIPQIKIRPIGKRRPDKELSAGCLGKIYHPERPHKQVEIKGKFGSPDCNIEFGITDDNIKMLISLMEKYQVTVVVGPTGSGKSTFLPYRLMVPPDNMGIDKDVFTRYGQIVITQPRIQATRSISRFVAEDLHGSSLGAGFDVGFRHSDAPCSDWRNKLVYITDGTLINWIVSGQICNLSVIMIDEAHERSLNIDLILGLLREQLPRFPHLKLIIASATINAELFQNYFGGKEKTGLLQFEGLKQHRVDAFFPHHDLILRNDRGIPGKMAVRIEEILIDISDGEKSEGDILGFLDGKGSIETCVTALHEIIRKNKKLRDRDIRVYPLYTVLPQEKQDLALAKKTNVIRDKVLNVLQNKTGLKKKKIIVLFLDEKSAKETKGMIEERLGKFVQNYNPPIEFMTHEEFSMCTNHDDYHVITDRRVVISTNVAETSLTIDGIVYVVDSGIIKESHWHSKEAANDLTTIFHSRAGCRQRWGRAGRVRDGEAHMLYTDLQFEDDNVFKPYTDPEIKRSSLDEVVLKAKSAGIDNLDNFKWIETEIPKAELKRAPEMMKDVSALDADGDLTGYGVELQSFGANVPVANLLVAADQYVCGVEMSTLAAMWQAASFKNSFLLMDRKWDFATRHQVKQIHENLSAQCLDDLEFYLKVYSMWAETSNDKDRTALCKLFFINEDVLKNKVLPARSKFIEMLSIGKKADEDRTISFSMLNRLRIILASTLQKKNIYKYENDTISYYADDSKKTHSFQIDEYSVDSKKTHSFQIDEYSVLSQKPPAFFLALSKNIIEKRDTQEKIITLSGIIQVKEEWLDFKADSPVLLALEISKELKNEHKNKKPGVDRHRLFVDVRYPVGAVFEVNDSTAPAPGRKISDPEPVDPVFAPEVRKDYHDASEMPESDTAPTAGCEDKDDRQIPYDSDEYDPGIPEISDDDEVFFTEDLYSDGLNFLIQSKEIEESKRLKPEFRLEKNSSTEGDEYRIAGYDFTKNYDPCVILNRYKRADRKEKTGIFRNEDKVLVKPGEVIELQNGKNTEKGLKVKVSDNGMEFIIGAKDLTFSGRYCLVDYFSKMEEFEMAVEKRCGKICLTRLPVAQDIISRYQKDRKNNNAEYTLVEQKNWNLNFVFDPGDETKEGAYMRLRNDSKNRYEKGKSYNLVLDRKNGATYEYIPCPTQELLDFVEKEKFNFKIFWNKEKSQLHTKTPMSNELRKKLLGFSDRSDFDFHDRIARLYRRSNSIRVFAPGPDFKSGSNKNFELETSDEICREEQQLYISKDIPEYEPGEKVKGKVKVILSRNVLVLLERGGTGSIQLKNLSWEKLIDPREVVYAGQDIETTVISQRGEYIELCLGNYYVQKVQITKNKIGMFIGKHGSNINKLEEKYKCRIYNNRGKDNNVFYIESYSENNVKKIVNICKKYLKPNLSDSFRSEKL